jgi:hypothetical protein
MAAWTSECNGDCHGKYRCNCSSSRRVRHDAAAVVVVFLELVERIDTRLDYRSDDCG